MGARVAVAGASGYAGGELLRLLAGHPDLEIGPVAAGSSAGRPVTDLHPQLASLAGHRFVPTDAGAAGRRRPGLPRPAARAVGGAGGRSCRDAPRSSTWAPTSGSPTPPPGPAFYGGPHAGPWTYGLPELPGARAAIAAARRVAVPGCYATASILALAPLLAAGLAEPTTSWWSPPPAPPARAGRPSRSCWAAR